MYSGLPYFKFLKERGKEKGKELGRADFAVIQREALENYLIGLIRAVVSCMDQACMKSFSKNCIQMFHPASNRLAGFLEISALSVQLAQSGGWQAKAGYLVIETATSKLGSFGRKNASRRDRRKQRWCAVRDSYIVALEELGEVSLAPFIRIYVTHSPRRLRSGMSFFLMPISPLKDHRATTGRG